MPRRPKHDRPAPLGPRATAARRAADLLRERIIDALQPGDVLPPERQLGDRLDVSRKTLRKAIDQLIHEGWLVRRPNRSPIVARPAPQPLRTSGLLFPYAASRLLNRPFYREVTTGLHGGALEAHRSILYMFATVERLSDLPETLTDLPNMRQVDSLLTLEIFNPDTLAGLARVHPVIALDVRCDAPGVSSVSFDHHLSVQMGHKYLLDLDQSDLNITIMARHKDTTYSEQTWSFYSKEGADNSTTFAPRIVFTQNVPEPATMGLLGLGGALMIGMRLRNRRRVA